MNAAYDVIVVGGGHSGIEAACAAFRMGAKVGLVTMREDNIGVMSCNPAIGGIGKGTIVREVDALDGIMPKAADLSTTSFKVLNSSKGPAVWGWRAQIDRKLYRNSVLKIFSDQYCGLDVICGEVLSLARLESGRFQISVSLFGSASGKSVSIDCASCVVATGTFLGSKMFTGFTSVSGGRVGEASANLLLNSLCNLGFKLDKIKTGTPPRLYRDTVDLTKLPLQCSDAKRRFFSVLTKKGPSADAPCYIARTNKRAHNVLLRNFHNSPVLTKKIDLKGPRYCPSIEDKIRRFGDRDEHIVFLEPEGFDSNILYPMGISTSMPVDVQLEFLRCMDGLERVEIQQPGYLVEYHYVNPTCLFHTLETKLVKNLFFAGQINGTTGYEEAAGQGVVAGINAALTSASGGKSLSFSRSDSFLGVMIDDLVVSGVGGEPYRVFTSRAENRLSIRADNAHYRLTELGIEIGCVGAEMRDKFLMMKEGLRVAKDALSNFFVSANRLSGSGLSVNSLGKGRSAKDLISMGCTIEFLFEVCPELKNLLTTAGENALFTAVADATYEPHALRQLSDVMGLAKASAYKLPPDFDYYQVGSLSAEVLEKLSNNRPADLAIASRIPGVTPAAIIAIMYHLSKSYTEKKYPF